MREPKITRAECVLSFDLSEGFKASLLSDIESAGIIQYHYLLVVYGQDTRPCLYVGSEWSRLDPSYKDEPVLGVFTSNAHANHGGSANWRDEYLFLLHAVEVAREQIQIKEGSLTEGEAWALTQMMKRLNQHTDDQATSARNAAYWKALSCNDGRLVAFLKSSNKKQDGLSAPVIMEYSSDAMRSAMQVPCHEEAAANAKKHAELIEAATRRARVAAMARGMVRMSAPENPSESKVALTPSQQEWIKFCAGGFLSLDQFDELWITDTGKRLHEHDDATIAAAEEVLMNSPDIVVADSRCKT